MKNYAKVGGKPGKPGYRTPSSFRLRKKSAVQNLKIYKIPKKNGKDKA
jgi:hypothetical protein